MRSPRVLRGGDSASTVAKPAAARNLQLLPSSASAVALTASWATVQPQLVAVLPVATPVVTTGVVVGTVPPAGEAQNVPLVVAAKSEV